ncbi:MAG: spore germination protein YaaH [Planctomycetota bacterium]|jgi:spore germination protein YaaH
MYTPKTLVPLLLLCLLLPITPVSLEASSSFKVAGWLPYWQDTSGIKSATKHMRDLDTLHPFVLEVQPDGTIKDRADLNESQWRRLLRDAKRRDVEIIPTITWFDGHLIHLFLSDKERRKEHIQAIVEMVDDGNFDGVDIDYESKLAITSQYFSLFLEELKEALGSDLLTCTVEARTPPSSLYREIPETLAYANDYTAMNEYCDRIELMTYDQQRADLLLNSSAIGEPYIPVADPAWVEKVIELALEDFDHDKIMLGVATYGRIWKLEVTPNQYRTYTNSKAINLPEAEALEKKYDITPRRNSAGELSFAYFPEDSFYKIFDRLPTPQNTPKGYEAAAKALLVANAFKIPIPVNIAWYSDAQAIEDKIDLIEKHNLRGVAIFKIDGEEDPDVWDLF